MVSSWSLHLPLPLLLPLRLPLRLHLPLHLPLHMPLYLPLNLLLLLVPSSLEDFQGLRIEKRRQEEEFFTVPRDPNRGNTEIYTSMQARSS
jgi:hypothetical protein